MRASMEIDDEEAKVTERRTWCDVCQRIVGSGQVWGGKDRESILHQAEIICTGCDSKYQRCTDVSFCLFLLFTFINNPISVVEVEVLEWV